MSTRRRKIRAFLISLLAGLLVMPVVSLTLSWFDWLSRETSPIQADVAAAQAEGPRLLSAGRGAVQQAWQKGGTPRSLTGTADAGGCGLDRAQLSGEHYVLLNAVIVTAGGSMELVAVPLAGDYPVLRLRFLPAEGGGELIVEPGLWEDG